MASVQSETEALKRMVENAIAIVTSFVSSLVLIFITELHNRVENTLIVFFSVLIWVFVDSQLRSLFANYRVTRQNEQWHAWLLRFLNFLILLGIFLVAQLGLLALKVAVDDGDLNALETVVFILVGLGTAFAVLICYQRLSQDLREQRN